jgi:N-acetylmuramoyl-L-alanine amidase
VGYPLDDRAAAVRSFHHHFRGMEGDTLDAQDWRVLYALACQLTASPMAEAVPAPVAGGR